MNILRLLALCLVSTSLTLSQAEAMKRLLEASEATEAKRPRTKKCFTIICKDGKTIDDVPESVLKVSPIITEMVIKATDNSISLNKIRWDAMTLIIKWMTFISNQNPNLVSADIGQKLSHHISKYCLETIKPYDLHKKQVIILSLLIFSTDLEIHALTRAIQLAICQNPGFFFARDTKPPYDYIIEHKIPDTIKALLNKAFLMARQRHETLSIIPGEIITTEIVSKLDARSMCNFACTTNYANAACTNIKLDQCCNIPRVFAVNAHSISMIEKFITFLENRKKPGAQDFDAKILDVDFESSLHKKITVSEGSTPNNMQEIESTDFNFTPQQMIIKAILLLWVNRKNHGTLLVSLLSIPEVQVLLTEILFDQGMVINVHRELWLDVTIGKDNENSISIGVRDILTTVMLWALTNKNLAPSVFLHGILGNVLQYKYHADFFHCIQYDHFLNQKLAQQMISFAIRLNMPYFLHYLLDDLHDKLGCFIDKKHEKAIFDYATKSLRGCPLMQRKILSVLDQDQR